MLNIIHVAAYRARRAALVTCVCLPSRVMASTSAGQQQNKEKGGSDDQGQQYLNVKQPPSSLVEYGSRKPHFSVTDLTSPLWCEYAFQYGIIGLQHLPVSQRPKEIKTPAGNIVRPDVRVAQQREKILHRGRKVHAKLEKEVHPIKVHVQTLTREDEWGLRILRMINGLQTLMDSGCCRELPVFGFVNGKMVMGIIDEISKRPLSRRLNRYLDQMEESDGNDSNTTIQQYFQSSKNAERTESDEHHTATDARGTKRWASQEEWKKAKRKSEAALKSTNKSAPRSPTKKTSAHEPAKGRSSIASFFKVETEEDKARETSKDDGHKSVEQKQPKERFGFFLEDSKTRMARLLPSLEDQQQSRLQCMLYKRLFDGLMLGSLAAPARNQLAKEAEALATDIYAKPVVPDMLSSYLNLSINAPLSDEFMHDAEELIDDRRIALQPQASSSPEGRLICTITSLVNMLNDVLQELAAHARQGMGWQASSTTNSGVLQNHLRLTYRKRKGKFHRSKGTGSTKAISATNTNAGTKVDDNHAPQLVDGSGDLETQMAIAIQIGMETPMDESVIEDDLLLDNGVVIPISSPSKPHDYVAPSQSSNAETTEEESDAHEDDPTAAKDKDIIGSVTFLHDSEKLKAHLDDIYKMWKGERALRGVTLEQSWRCYQCEFRHDCEWREAKGKEKLDQAMNERMLRYNAHHAHDDNDKYSHSTRRSDESQENEKIVTKVVSVSKVNLDDEEALWSQFQDIADEGSLDN